MSYPPPPNQPPQGQPGPQQGGYGVPGPYGPPPGSGYGPPPGGGYGPPPGNPYGAPVSAGRKVSLPMTGWLLVLAGVVAVVGSVTTWATLNLKQLQNDHVRNAPKSISGADHDGRITVVFAALIAVLGLLIIIRRGRLWVSIVALVLAVLTVIVAFADIGSVANAYDDLDAVGIKNAVSVGWGLWLVLVGGILGLAFSIWALVKRSPR